MTWAGYAAGFAAFFLTHSIPIKPTVKSRVIAKIGAGGFGMAYSMLSSIWNYGCNCLGIVM